MHGNLKWLIYYIYFRVCRFGLRTVSVLSNGQTRIDESCSRFTANSHRLSCTPSLTLGSLSRACYCLVHRGTKGYLWWERGRCTLINFELVQILISFRYARGNIQSILMQLLFSFDRGMKVEKTLMQTLDSQLPCNSCSR